MTGIVVFDFEESSVRSLLIDGEPWFVGKDVCRCLEIANHRDALGRLAGDEREDGVGITDPIGREQMPVLVSEPGVYRLVFTSRTDAAERFRRWLAHDVLPAIRKTGRYVVSGQQAPDDVPISDIEFDDLRKAAPILREWRLLYGKASARRLAQRLPVPQVASVDTLTDDGDDDAAAFADEIMVRAQGARTSAADIYAAYLDWCQDNEARPMTQTAFGRRLSSLGWDKERVAGRVVYVDATTLTTPTAIDEA